MSRRTRPSGAGSNSRRFVERHEPDGSLVRVPAVKDAGSFVYIREHGGGWPNEPVVTLAYDAQWLTEGAVLELKEMRPGHGMGRLTMVQVVELRIQIGLFEGKYGQVHRLALVAPIEHDDRLAALSVAELETMAGDSE